MASEKTDAPAEYPTDLHNTLSFEQTLMSMVRRGDTAALSEWAKHAPPIRGGIIAFDQLRQMKNMFIVSVTLASRAAIRGGMDADDALMLSDRYIQRCELMNTAEEITNLQFHMISDYTARVERLKIGSDPSQLIAAVSNYIQHHISESVTTEAIAQSLYISRTHLSARFHKETGMTLSDFILKEKRRRQKACSVIRTNLSRRSPPISAFRRKVIFQEHSVNTRVSRPANTEQSTPGIENVSKFYECDPV